MPKEEETPKKVKGNKLSTILKIAFVVLIIVVAFSIVGYPRLTGHAIIECEKQVQTPYEAQESYTVNEPYNTQECSDVQVPYTTQECSNVQVPYTEQQCGYVQVPYNAQECHNIQVPVNSQSCNYVYYTYEISNLKNTGFSYLPWHIYCEISFTLNNHETQGGYFSYQATFKNVSTTIQRGLYTEWIDANSAKDLSLTYNCKLGEDIIYGTPQVTPPQKQVCSPTTEWVTQQQCENVIKYNSAQQCQAVTKYTSQNKCSDVTKYRTENQCSNVVKYHDVTKYRTITKYRTDTIKSFSACLG